MRGEDGTDWIVKLGSSVLFEDMADLAGDLRFD